MKYTIIFSMLIIALVSTLCAQEKPPRPPLMPVPEPIFIAEKQKPPLPPQPVEPPVRVEEIYLPSDLEDEALLFIKEDFPEKYERLLPLKVHNPMEYKENILRAYQEKKKLEQLQQVDIERYKLILQQRELEKQCRKLAEQYRNAEAKSKEKIEKELQALLEKLFEQRESDKQRELDRLEKEIAKLKEMIEFRKTNKDKIIEKHLKEMVGEYSSLEW